MNNFIKKIPVPKSDQKVESDCAMPSSEHDESSLRSDLLQGLIKCFNLSELKTLCFDLGIDFEVLGGDGKEDKARELISFLDRRGKVKILIEYCTLVRPHFIWPRYITVSTRVSHQETSELQQLSLDLLETLLIKERLGIEFDLPYYPPPIEIPSDPDTPYVASFWCSSNSPQLGESVTILFRVVDKGLNFSGNELLEIVDISSRKIYRAFRQGRGFYACRLEFANDESVGRHNIEFKLADSEGKVHKQIIGLDVKSCT